MLEYVIDCMAGLGGARLGTAWQGKAWQGPIRMAFKLVTTWIEGTRPLLMNRATEEGLSSDGTRRSTPRSEEDPRQICERAVYRLDGGQLAVPGAAFARLLREAGGSHRATGSRKSLKYIVPAAVLVLDELAGLYETNRRTKLIEFEVDSRPVTIPATKGRIMRHRARVNTWACKIGLRINDELLSEALVRQLLTEGTQQIGIGDFRPERGGPFGTGSVVLWEVQNQRERIRLRAVD